MRKILFYFLSVLLGDLGALLLVEGGAGLPGHQVGVGVHDSLAGLVVLGGALLVVGD
jgi:hypothetical protein